MFHPQTTEIQPSKFECFSTKMLKIQEYDGIIWHICADFRISFGMWNSIVLNYPCARFHTDMAINNRITHLYRIREEYFKSLKFFRTAVLKTLQSHFAKIAHKVAKSKYF